MKSSDSILNCIDSPKDLKNLNEADRKKLAEELRHEIIDTVSRTGGHLASNLGVVELTIALHTVFESPKDKVVWDVAHQSYSHKLLTGRRKDFAKLRQDGGLSGFTRMDESPHDPFGAGHASTSVSAALGLAKARDLLGTGGAVIAVLGDGSLTGGLALEGLNNAEQLKTDVIVVLNDNQMSISENVTAVSLHLAKLRTAPLYQRVENRAKQMVGKMPAGRSISHAAEGLSHGFVRLLSKTGVMFEELGFTYLGPIDGHNTETMISVLQSARQLKGPVLLHVVTEKGKGYEYAENNARAFHGIPGFDVNDGTIEHTVGNCSYTKAFSETICELAEKDQRIVGITAAMPDGTGLSRMAEKYPDRFYDVGIAEEHAVTFAAGLAAGGLRPVVALYSTFLQRAYDQVLHDVCLQNLPVVFAVDRAGLVGEDGPTHHGVYDMSFLRQMPRMVVSAPKDTIELRHLLATALKHDGPFAIRYPRGGGPCEYAAIEPQILAIGKGEVLREGTDAAILAVGSTVYPAMDAASILEHMGISVRVVNARYIKPLDEQLIISTLNIGGPILVVEENSVVGGFGSAVLELASSSGCDVGRISLLGVPDAFLEHGETLRLKESIGLAAETMADRMARIMSKYTTGVSR
jgi:1-deoxy-D-xylulose-5-phosphate synthase